MRNGMSESLLVAGVATIITSGVLGEAFPLMYYGIIIGVITVIGGLPPMKLKRRSERKIDDLNISFDGTATQTGMSL